MVLTRCHEGCYLHKCCVPQSRLLGVTHLSATLVLFLSSPQFSKTRFFSSGLSSPLGRKLKNKILGHVLLQHLMLAFVSSCLQFFPRACSAPNPLSARISSLCSVSRQNIIFPLSLESSPVPFPSTRTGTPELSVCA